MASSIDEQTMLDVAATYVGPLDRVVVRATGTERLTYLDAVLSQRLRGAAAGTATSALELGPHGEPTGVLDLGVLDEHVLVLVPGAQADEVIGRLAGRTFLSDAAFAALDEATTLRLRGADPHGTAARAGIVAEPGACVVLDDDVTALGWTHGIDLVGDADAIADVRSRLAAAGAIEADPAMLDAAEVVAGVPRAPDEITRGRLPEEIGILPTHVHLSKGCYPGQEAVARMWMLGRPRRRLATLRLGEAVTNPGQYGETRGGVALTRIAATSTGRVGLGFVAADAQPGDTPVDGIEVLHIVGDGVPVPGHDPAMTRRRDR